MSNDLRRRIVDPQRNVQRSGGRVRQVRRRADELPGALVVSERLARRLLDLMPVAHLDQRLDARLRRRARVRLQNPQRVLQRVLTFLIERSGFDVEAARVEGSRVLAFGRHHGVREPQPSAGYGGLRQESG